MLVKEICRLDNISALKLSKFLKINWSKGLSNKMRQKCELPLGNSIVFIIKKNNHLDQDNPANYLFNYV
jgi:hypothetical protein